jgi:hypothetical protein
MSRAAKLLIIGGVALAAFGMLYGLHYAIFIEHQSLDGMGMNLTQAFLHSAERNVPEAHASLAAYATTKFNYVRQVDVHSHWIGLAMLMIVLGVVFERVGFSDHTRFWLALMLLLGSVIFPLGVILQTANHGLLPSAFAVVGSAMVIVSLAAIAFGFARQGTSGA